MNELTEDELTTKAVHLLTRGSSYRAIRVFLKRNCDEAMEERIVQTLIQFENDHKEEVQAGREKLKRDLAGENEFSAYFYRGFSAVMICLGAVLSVVFWNSGWLMAFPVSMIGVGGYGLFPRSYFDR